MNASSEPKHGLESASSGSLGNSVALDQWRGLALVFVLVSHGFYFTERVHGIGRVGVNLFFFISGVLVFRSLAKSRATTPLALAIQKARESAARAGTGAPTVNVDGPPPGD